MPDLAEMLRQAQALQSKVKALQEELAALEFTATAGAVTVVVNGKHELKQVNIKPEALSSGDPAMLPDLLKVAINEAGRQVNDRLKSEMGRMTGGLLPPGLF